MVNYYLNFIIDLGSVRFPSSSLTPQSHNNSTTKLSSQQSRWMFSKDRSYGLNQPEIKDLSKYQGQIDGHIEERKWDRDVWRRYRRRCNDDDGVFIGFIFHLPERDLSVLRMDMMSGAWVMRRVVASIPVRDWMWKRRGRDCESDPVDGEQISLSLACRIAWSHRCPSQNWIPSMISSLNDAH